MEKDNRRNHFDKKQHHQQKEKSERNKKEELSANITEHLDFDSIEDVEGFMEERYEGICEKVPGSIPTVNKTLLKRLMELRDAWIESEKERCINFMRENGVEKA